MTRGNAWFIVFVFLFVLVVGSFLADPAFAAGTITTECSNALGSSCSNTSCTPGQAVARAESCTSYMQGKNYGSSGWNWRCNSPSTVVVSPDLCSSGSSVGCYQTECSDSPRVNGDGSLREDILNTGKGYRNWGILCDSPPTNHSNTPEETSQNCAFNAAFCSSGSDSRCNSGTDYCQWDRTWTVNPDGSTDWTTSPGSGQCVADFEQGQTDPECFGWCPDGNGGVQYNPPPSDDGSGGDDGGSEPCNPLLSDCDGGDPATPGSGENNSGDSGCDPATQDCDGGTSDNTGGGGGSSGGGTGDGGTGDGGTGDGGTGDGGTGGGGVPGDGVCDPATETCDESGGTGGQASGCGQPPTCQKPGTIECAILMQSWRNACQYDADFEDMFGEGTVPIWNDPAVLDEEFSFYIDPLAESDLGIDDSGFLGGGSCPTYPSVSVAGVSINFDFAAFCTILQVAGFFIVGVASLLAARIVMGGV